MRCIFLATCLNTGWVMMICAVTSPTARPRRLALLLPRARRFISCTATGISCLQRYAAQSGMTLLADPVVVDLYGIPTLLTHGDILCTDDRRYQLYRKWVRKPISQKLLLRLPLKLRHALAGSARAGSEQAKAEKPYAIMDANHATVTRLLLHYGVTRIIHGHTHRPARHEFTVSGKQCERWVLPDWYDEGGYLACTADGCKLGPV
jgi:UDP-2,3-diacylglucosamine hydrolase